MRDSLLNGFDDFMEDWAAYIKPGSKNDVARWGGWGPNTKYYLDTYYLAPLHQKIAFLDSQWTVSEQQLLCDINEDTLVDTTDLAMLINRIISDSGALVSEGVHYDANNDGAADITDVACVINYILNH